MSKNQLTSRGHQSNNHEKATRAKSETEKIANNKFNQLKKKNRVTVVSTKA